MFNFYKVRLIYTNNNNAQSGKHIGIRIEFPVKS
jgi:hypothetical protein